MLHNTLFISLCILFVGQSIMAQSALGRITIRVDNINVSKSKGNEIVIPIEIVNSSTTDVVLVAIKKTFVLPAIFDSVFFSTLGKSGGAGSALILEDENKNRIPLIIDDCDDCGHITLRSNLAANFLDSLQEVVREKYQRTTVKVKPREKLSVQLAFDLSDTNIQSGCYDFHIVYYVSPDSIPLLNEQFLEQINKKGATIPFGWIKSNNGKLCLR